MDTDSLVAPEELIKKFPKETSLELFRRICLCRNFELNVKKAYDQNLMPKIPIYLSLGQETATAAVSIAFSDAVKKLGQHRNHDLYLCHGGSPEKLRDELLGLPTGCAGGMGGCASIHSPEIGMVGHDGHMATQVKIGTGYALGSGQKVLITMGDASAEEGYAIGAMGMAATKRAPILFVCMDNNLSIKTKKKERRIWEMIDVAKAFKMLALDIVDDPWIIMHHVEEIKNNLPAFLNIRYCRELWHAGTGCDGPPEWDRYGFVKRKLASVGLRQEVMGIENGMTHYVNNIWKDVFSPKEQA